MKIYDDNLVLVRTSAERWLEQTNKYLCDKQVTSETFVIIICTFIPD